MTKDKNDKETKKRRENLRFWMEVFRTTAPYIVIFLQIYLITELV